MLAHPARGAFRAGRYVAFGPGGLSRSVRGIAYREGMTMPPDPNQQRPPTSRMDSVGPDSPLENTQGMPAPEPIEPAYTAPPPPESYAPYASDDAASPQAAVTDSGSSGGDKGRTVILTLFVLIAAALLAVAIAFVVINNRDDGGSGSAGGDQGGAGGGATTSQPTRTSETTEEETSETSERPTTSGSQITYEITGRGVIGGVSYQGADGVVTNRFFSAPWSTTVTRTSGTVFFRATVNTGTFTCSISVDGFPVVRAEASGLNGSLDCTYQLPS